MHEKELNPVERSDLQDVAEEVLLALRSVDHDVVVRMDQATSASFSAADWEKYLCELLLELLKKKGNKEHLAITIKDDHLRQILLVTIE